MTGINRRFFYKFNLLDVNKHAPFRVSSLKTVLSMIVYHLYVEFIEKSSINARARRPDIYETQRKQISYWGNCSKNGVVWTKIEACLFTSFKLSLWIMWTRLSKIKTMIYLWDVIKQACLKSPLESKNCFKIEKVIMFTYLIWFKLQCDVLFVRRMTCNWRYVNSCGSSSVGEDKSQWAITPRLRRPRKTDGRLPSRNGRFAERRLSTLKMEMSRSSLRAVIRRKCKEKNHLKKRRATLSSAFF